MKGILKRFFMFIALSAIHLVLYHIKTPQHGSRRRQNFIQDKGKGIQEPALVRTREVREPAASLNKNESHDAVKMDEGSPQELSWEWSEVSKVEVHHKLVASERFQKGWSFQRVQLEQQHIKAHTISRLRKHITKDPCRPYTGQMITGQHHGRLGNQMSKYATLFGLSKCLDAHVLMTKDMQFYLDKAFTNIQMKIAPNHCDLTFKRAYTPTKFLCDLHPLENRIRKTDRLTLAFEDFTDLHTFYPHLAELRQHFKFQKKIAEASEGFLRLIKGAFKSKNLVYIGMHVRQTDYIRFLRKRCVEDNIQLPSKEWYVQALEVMLKDLMYPSHYVAIVVSDSKTWCRDHLKRHSKRIVCMSDHYQQLKRLGIKRKSEKSLFELSLLSRCNHSIFDFGTFGMWGALLAGGKTILPFGVCKNHYVLKRVLMDFRVPNWKGLYVNGSADVPYNWPLYNYTQELAEEEQIIAQLHQRHRRMLQ